MMRVVMTPSNSCSVSETVKTGERFDAPDKPHRIDTTREVEHRCMKNARLSLAETDND